MHCKPFPANLHPIFPFRSVKEGLYCNLNITQLPLPNQVKYQKRINSGLLPLRFHSETLQNVVKYVPTTPTQLNHQT